MAFFWAPGCSSWFPSILGTEVDDALYGSWRHCFVALLYLTAKPTHVRDNMDGIAYPLHHPMACGHQTRGQGLLPGVVLSRHYSGAVAPFNGCEAPRLGYLVEY
jgi:hypothetical protein